MVEKFLQKNRFIRIFFLLMVFYYVFALGLYWIAGEQMQSVSSQTSTIAPSMSDGGLIDKTVLEQDFQVKTDTLDALQLFAGTYGRTNQSTIQMKILEKGRLVWEQEYSAQNIQDWTLNTFELDEPLLDVKGKKLTLHISSDGTTADQAISFYYGNTVSASKVEVAVQVEDPLRINGVPVNGTLCLSLEGRDLLMVKQLYWPGVILVSLLLGWAYWHSYRKYTCFGTGLFMKLAGLYRYSFLMKQLVSRDFKTKYKRSVLGVLWSFMNPLLTMSVQYLIFASLFKSNVENFAVYLLTGGVIFNSFSESVGMGLTSIVANAPLITKVYVPKYIYPTTRVISSGVNMLISMVPLAVIIVLSGLPIRKSMLLIPLVLIYTLVFCIGMSLLLSSAMVFFRDTQFLWGILSMLWMYMTPIFYPESIIPQKFIGLYHMNPLYQFIYFFREITINGVAPSPYTFLYCTLAAGIPLLLGVWVFRKTQDRFVFYL